MIETPVIFETRVGADLIDYNGHMTEYAYARVFSDALTKLLEDIDVGSAYRLRTGCTMYSLESHTVFLKEAKLGAPLSVTCRVIDFDAKRMHLLLDLYDDGTLISSCENISLHVRQPEGGSPRAASFEDRLTDWLADRKAADHHLPQAAFAGRAMSLKKRA